MIWDLSHLKRVNKCGNANIFGVQGIYFSYQVFTGLFLDHFPGFSLEFHWKSNLDIGTILKIEVAANLQEEN